MDFRGTTCVTSMEFCVFEYEAETSLKWERTEYVMTGDSDYLL